LTEHLSITTTELRELIGNRWALRTDDVIFRIGGPGALSCLQGIFTNDLIAAGDNSLVWGAVLTPKGMIITDLWLRRTGAVVIAVVPAAGSAAFSDLIRKSFPPRLARIEPGDAPLAAWWLTGEALPQIEGIDVAKPTELAPFAALAIGATDAGDHALADAGFPAGPPFGRDVISLLAGWPVLGREIDERTLVQEVRFDELKGVKYDKGCFTGQETVARLHFRGHPNKTLRAITAKGKPPAESTITMDSKEVGHLLTLLSVEECWVATSKLRREVVTGTTVTVGATDVGVHEFPILPQLLMA
jgi:folate-binding protein YgfZ